MRNMEELNAIGTLATLMDEINNKNTENCINLYKMNGKQLFIYIYIYFFLIAR